MRRGARTTFPPKAWPRAWWPRQTPRTAARPAAALMRSSVIPAWSGVPGPGEITIAEGAAQAQVAHRAAVQPAALGLQLVDDLHGPDLGRARQRPRRERGRQRVEGVLPLAQLARHRADDVHDVAVVLHGHELGHADAAEPAHAAEVVAAEVHQHDVLGPLLLVGEQLLA